ncbi:MAG: hypothetical protein WA655_10680 [Candidatus Korobacteraceae bacterium]
MARMTKLLAFVFWVALMMTATAPAQTQRQREAFSVQGYSGQTNVMRLQGRVFVDVQDLARITNGSLSFDGGNLVLTLSGCENSERPNRDPVKAGFSRSFMTAAIGAMGSIREWGGILQATVQDRYPVGTPMTGNTIIAYQERAADSVALASAAASTDSDYRGLELLRNEFNNLKGWTDTFFQARKSLTAQYMTLTDTPLQDDDEAQKIIHCGQFLAQMFPSGTFQDDAVCHKY